VAGFHLPITGWFYVLTDIPPKYLPDEFRVRQGDTTPDCGVLGIVEYDQRSA